MKTYTIELDTPEAGWEDDTVEVTLEEVSDFTKIQTIVNCPDDVKALAASDRVDRMPSGTIEWMKILVETTSDFPPELLDELSMDAINTLLGACVDVFEDKDPNETLEDDVESDPFGDLDLDEDGTLDPDEWR